jgi:hypothetical protein
LIDTGESEYLEPEKTLSKLKFLKEIKKIGTYKIYQVN